MSRVVFPPNLPILRTDSPMMTQTPRIHLCADGLVKQVRAELKKVPEYRKEPGVALIDALMAGYAVFALKSPSLLAYEEYARGNAFNLASLFGIKQTLSDTQMRAILDPIDPKDLRPAFTSVFRQLQRGKALESFVFWEGHYLLAADGTTYHASEKVQCKHCLEKKSRNGVTTHYHQMLGLAVVHPDHKEVIALCPEPIVKQDGSTKNDGERSATRRALADFRREHPHLKTIIVEDALSANAPHLEDLKAANVRFSLGVKPGSHAYLFEQMEQAHLEGRTQVLTLVDQDGTLHHFRWLHRVSLNQTHADVEVSMLEYWEIPIRGSRQPIRHFSWITDLTFDENGVTHLARGGRTRWHIENETFNTLKNQGYHFEHNFGHGMENLSVVFAMLMMLAFLVDQAQQLCDPLFQAVLNKLGRKCRLWERMRHLFHCFQLSSIRHLYELLLTFKLAEPPILSSG
jgi:hypothetical protein